MFMQQLIFLYNKGNIFFYILQHVLYNNLSFYYDKLNLLKILSLIFIGMFTSLTPCFISIVPLLVSSATIFTSLKLSKKICLFSGLISSFIFLIFILYISNGTAYHIFNHFRLISSIIFIVISLNLLDIIPISFSFKNINLNHYNFKNMYIQSYITGFGIGLGCLPCNCSIILSTVLWVYDEDRLIESIIYLFMYLFGCLLPFFIIIFSPFKVFQWEKFIYLWNYLIPLVSFYMLTSGCFMFVQYLL